MSWRNKILVFPKLSHFSESICLNTICLSGSPHGRYSAKKFFLHSKKHCSQFWTSLEKIYFWLSTVEKWHSKSIPFCKPLAWNINTFRTNFITIHFKLFFGLLDLVFPKVLHLENAIKRIKLNSNRFWIYCAEWSYDKYRYENFNFLKVDYQLLLKLSKHKCQAIQ